MNYLQQAYKGKNEGWRYFLVLILVLIGWQFIGIIPLSIIAIFHTEDFDAFQRSATDSFMSIGIDANLFLFGMIMMFAIGLSFLFFGIKNIHQRSITSLLTGRKKLDLNRIFFAFSVWAFFALMLFAVEYLITPDIFIWNFKLVPFTILVLISFILLPIQTSFEEILFRGYFMQGLGVLTKTRWFPLFFTSFLFGLAHISNPEIEKLGEIILIYYIGTGFLFAMTTLMDEGLEISLGMHAANNIITAVFVTADWSVFQTDALFIDSSEPNVSLEALIPVFVIYPIMLFIFSKKYHWKNWKEKLFGKI